MRRNATWAAVVTAAALLQTTWLEHARFLGVLPDIMVLLVVYFALREGEEWAMLTAVLGGVFQDVAGNTALGHHVLGLAVVGFVIGRVTTRLITEHPAVKVGLVFLSSVAAGVIYTGIQYVQRPGTPLLTVVLARVIPAAFYTALITPLVFWFVERTVGRLFTPQTPVAE